MKRLLGITGCLVVLGLTAPALGAQVRFGAQGSFGSDDVDFGIGGRVKFGLGSVIKTAGFEGIASFDYFFPSGGSGVDLTYWEINTNLAYTIPRVRGGLAPYVGGGLNIAHASVDITGFGSASNTEAGLNLLGGTKFKVTGSRVAPFAEIRVELGGGEIFVLTGGVVF